METIVIISEHKLICAQSQQNLESHLPNLKFVYYPSVQKLINDCDNINPNLVIVEASKNFFKAQQFFENTSVKVALCMQDLNRNQLQQLLMYNFSGFFLCGMDCTEFSIAIKMILKNISYVHPKILEVAMSNNYDNDLKMNG